MAELRTPEQLQADALVRALLAGGPGGTTQAGVLPTGSGGPAVPSFNLPQPLSPFPSPAPGPASPFSELPPQIPLPGLPGPSRVLPSDASEIIAEYVRRKVTPMVKSIMGSLSENPIVEALGGISFEGTADTIDEVMTSVRDAIPSGPEIRAAVKEALAESADRPSAINRAIEKLVKSPQPGLRRTPPAETGGFPEVPSAPGAIEQIIAAMRRTRPTEGQIEGLVRSERAGEKGVSSGIDPAAITADITAGFAPGATVPEFEGRRSQPAEAGTITPPTPSPPKPPGPSPDQVPSGGALNDIERLLGSEAFSGQLQPPDFTRAGEALQRSAPTAPQGLSTVEKLLNVVGGAAAGARGGGNLAETILGAGGGAARGAAASRAEDTRRQERFEDLSSRFAQAETNFELARVQAQQDTTKANLAAARSKAELEIGVMLDIMKVEKPVLRISGNKWIMTQFDAETGEITTTTGVIGGDVGDELSVALDILRGQKLQQEISALERKATGEDILVLGNVKRIQDGSMKAAVFQMGRDRGFQEQMVARGMHHVILQNSILVKKQLRKLPGSVRPPGQGYTEEERDTLREAFSLVSRSDPRILKLMEAYQLSEAIAELRFRAEKK